ncbi:MAG: nucleotidyltransferase [Opitutaceae bacterium]
MRTTIALTQAGDIVRKRRLHDLDGRTEFWIAQSPWVRLEAVEAIRQTRMTPNPDFREFIALLEKRGVEFLIVGGYAVGFHGFPRYTGDCDILVAVSKRNAAAIVAVFSEFGLKEADFLEEDMIVEIGREPMKIQILTGVDGVKFDACYRRRVFCDVDGIKLPFIALEDLMANKAASPRAKDKIDLEELRKIRDQDWS